MTKSRWRMEAGKLHGWALAGFLALGAAAASDPTGPPRVGPLQILDNRKLLRFAPYPAAEVYRIERTPDLTAPFSEATSRPEGFQWRDPDASTSSAFYRLAVQPLDANALLSATLLNRLAYGPTPDEWDRVTRIGPQAYLAEQLAPEKIEEALDIDQIPAPVPGWQYVTVTGAATSGKLYLYLNTAGDGYLDDLKLVAGSVPENGRNLIRNGDFESLLKTNDWQIAPNHAGSAIVPSPAHSGSGAMHLVATSGGETQGSAIVQDNLALTQGQTYTLSYWFLPGTSRPATLTVRLSGRGLESSPGGTTLMAKLANHAATIDDLRAWHVLHAVRSRRQLLETLLQFCENHFVTEYSKTRDYFDQFYPGTEAALYAAQMEFKEIERWRQALLRPDGTFLDLLRISAESPAMIVYLDTVNSRGDGNNIANENYARELLELFTFGVDNGYDQEDITVLSRAWTGWTVRLVAATNEFNPLAPQTTLRVPGAPNGAITNLIGVWSVGYRADRHHNGQKVLFPGKTVPERFGAPWAGRNYELRLPTRVGTPNGGDAGLQDGYAVLEHLADQPFTQEFISVKLCRLLVHDDFAVGYDFRDPELSPEGRLVRECMLAWENGSPRGQIRTVLAAIFSSEFFRGHGGSRHKVKTPLEYVVSAVRALRAEATAGQFTATTDGYIQAVLERLGGMRLFDRAEPNGYPETAAPWISAGTLAERLRFVQSLLMTASASGRDAIGQTTADPAALVRARVPQAQWTDAGTVADLFLTLLFAGEGKANLDLHRTAAIGFLDTADDGATASPFAGLVPTGAAYDIRLRGMVAMLMLSPRFQEQ